MLFFLLLLLNIFQLTIPTSNFPSSTLISSSSSLRVLFLKQSSHPQQSPVNSLTNPINLSDFPSVELDALKDLYDSTRGDNWAWPTGAVRWNFTQHQPNPCYEGWSGIGCTSNCSNNDPCNVIALFLESYHLVGSLPHTIGNLTFLERLSFHNNTLQGSLPIEIGYLYHLDVLILSSNKFSHHLPESIGYLFNLQALFLDDNHFSGRLPTTIGGLLYLYILMIGSNQFTGTLPSAFGMLQELRILGINACSSSSSSSISMKYIISSLFSFSSSFLLMVVVMVMIIMLVSYKDSSQRIMS
jgi:hypothetical protein